MVLLETSRKKQSNKSWEAEGEKARTVVKIGRFESKNLFTIFFRTSGVVHISYLDKGKTIDHQTYNKKDKRLLKTSCWYFKGTKANVWYQKPEISP